MSRLVMRHDAIMLLHRQAVDINGYIDQVPRDSYLVTLPHCGPTPGTSHNSIGTWDVNSVILDSLADVHVF